MFVIGKKPLTYFLFTVPLACVLWAASGVGQTSENPQNTQGPKQINPSSSEQNAPSPGSEDKKNQTSSSATPTTSPSSDASPIEADGVTHPASSSKNESTRHPQRKKSSAKQPHENKASAIQPNASRPSKSEGRKDHVNTDAGTSTAKIQIEKDVPPAARVMLKSQESPLAFLVEHGVLSAQERAEKASVRLEEAMNGAKNQEGLLVRTTQKEGVFELHINDVYIAVLTEYDAKAAKTPLQEFVEGTRKELQEFIDTQLRRRVLQSFALNLLLSILIAAATFFVFRLVSFIFQKWDNRLYEARDSLASLSILRVPVVTGETWGGTLAVGLVVGRYLSYLSIFVLGVGAILSLFESTRIFLTNIGLWSLDLLLNAAETIVGSVPGIVLAIILIIAGRAALRVIHVLLNGVANRQLSWPLLSPDRVPVIRTLATILIVITIGPLAISAAFGQFGSPLEWIVLFFAGVLCLALLPVLVSYAAGLLTIWNRSITLGDWVQLHDISGEVIDVSPGSIRIVPETGGIIVIPMLLLLFRPLHRIKEPPAVSFELTIGRDQKVQDILKIVEKVVHSVEPNGRVECTQIYEDWIDLCISAPSVRAGIRQTLLIALGDALKDASLTLRPHPLSATPKK